MKRFLIFPCILSLVIGLLVGILLPIDLSGQDAPPAVNSTPSNFTPPPGVSQPEGSSSSTLSADTDTLDLEDNFPLLGSAFSSAAGPHWPPMSTPAGASPSPPTPPWNRTAT